MRTQDSEGHDTAPVVTVDQLAAHLQVSPKTVYRLCRQGWPHVRVGTLIRFSPGHVDQWLSGNPATTAAVLPSPRSRAAHLRAAAAARPA